LLTGVFEFYATLEIRKVIISPRLGHLLPRDVTPEQLPPELPSFLTGLQLDQPFCLQDPFELNFNAAKNLQPKVAAVFQGYMAAAAKAVVFSIRTPVILAQIQIQLL
jgi:Cid1 family poly A polymerase